MSSLRRFFSIKVFAVCRLYVQKVEKQGRKQGHKQGRKQAEVDRVICWLTGYTRAGLEMQLKQGESAKGNTMEKIFRQ